MVHGNRLHAQQHLVLSWNRNLTIRVLDGIGPAECTNDCGLHDLGDRLAVGLGCIAYEANGNHPQFIGNVCTMKKVLARRPGMWPTGNHLQMLNR